MRSTAKTRPVVPTKTNASDCTSAPPTIRGTRRFYSKCIGEGLGAKRRRETQRKEKEQKSHRGNPLVQK